MPTRTHHYGTTFSRSTNGSSYTQISGDVVNITPPAPSRGSVRTSHLSTPDKTHSYEGGWSEGNSVTFTMWFDKSSWAAIVADYDAATNLYWRIEYPLIDSETTESQDNFRGYVESYGKEQIGTDDNAIMGTISIKLTAKPSFVAGT